MEEFKLYSVSDDYVEWLRKDFPNVYSNKKIVRIRISFTMK
jgi:protein AbiQ